MTETEKMVQEMNGFFKMLGEKELSFPRDQKWASELDLLKGVKEEYKRRLLQQVPKYKAIASEDLIPDMFLQALRKREHELESRTGT